MKKLIIVFQIIVSLCYSFGLFAQNESENELDKLKKAYLYVQEENYKEALPYFREMLYKYPKDPTYNYYVGRCLLFAGQDYQKALDHLKFASVRNVPADVYFYMGLIYLKTYHFEDAIANFRWFEKSASKKEARIMMLDNYISMAQNGLYLIKYFKKPQVYSKKYAFKDDFYASYDLKGLEGRFFDRYRFLNSERDSLDEQSLIFVPNFIEKNEVLYFSARNKKRGDYDIFRITRLTNDSWSEPENLGDVINTPFDENYPFIHTDGTTLYFASKGHYSMGGYDLYKSTWNWEEQTWTEPENLDFPINSPFDDILFVPSVDMKTAFFSSNRNIKDGKIEVYKIKLDAQQPYVEYLNTNQITDIAQLNVNITEEKKAVKKDEVKTKYKAPATIVKANNDDFLFKSEYDSLLNLAVNLQLKADSLRWAIDDKRSVFEQTEDGSERAQIGNEIINLERTIYSIQKQADACYGRVREIEQQNLAKKNVTYEKTVEKEQVEESAAITKVEQKVEQVVEPKDNGLSKYKLEAVADDGLNEELQDFGLQVKSPSEYNSENPIKINDALPNGVVYMIQLGAFSSKKEPSVFNGLYPIRCIQNSNGTIYKYYAGLFWRVTDAEKKVSLVKSKGFKDAYVVAFNNGKMTPINSAVKMERENPPEIVLTEKKEDQKPKVENLDVIYVIQGELSLDSRELIDSIREMMDESIELFVKTNANSMELIINSFATYDDAFQLKAKLEGILQKELEIHAYFAENQIPLEQARKITK